MRSNQQGLAAPGWLALFFVVAAVIMFSLKTVPHYIDYQTIVTIVEALSNQKSVHEMSNSEIREAIKKRFNINNIRNLDPKHVVAIERGKGMTSLEVSYERRENVIGNIDIVMVFKRTFEFT